MNAQIKTAPHALTKSELPNTPAAIRAIEILSVINEGKKSRISDYLSKNAVASLHDEADFLLMVHHHTFNLVVERIENTDEQNSAKFLLNSEMTGLPMNFSVTVDKDAPHKIANFRLDFAEVPPGGEKISLQQATQEFNDFFVKVCKADMFSGAVLLAKNDKIFFQSACGEANKDFEVGNTIDTKFNLGSMNKMFTAVAIAQLMEQGKLQFDNPLSKFLPDFPDKKSAQKIQISHLLSHSSGLGNYFNDKYNATPKEQLKAIDDLLNLVKNHKLEFEPGAKFQYSNTGFLVLGKVIEVITGKSYFDYIREHIYAPAGMFHSDSFDLTQVNKNLAVGYDLEYTDNGYNFRNNLFRHVVKGGPAGGGYSTVGDLWKFSLALQNGKLIQAKTLEEMTLPTLHKRFGYGFELRTGPQGRIIGHGGGFPGISSNLSIFLDKGYTAVVLSNYTMAATVVAVKIERLLQRIRD